MNNHINSNDTQGIQKYLVLYVPLTKIRNNTTPMLVISCIYFNVENAGISLIVTCFLLCIIMCKFCSQERRAWASMSMCVYPHTTFIEGT
jgi:hypothetical protein